MGLLVTGLVTWLVVRWGILDRVAARLSRRGPNLRAFLVAATFADPDRADVQRFPARPGRRGPRRGSRAALADPTSLPVLLFVVALFGLVAQPALNALIRAGEIESDRYSLETENLPDALASALVKTAEYRYPRPNALQEFLFYSHPSVERRVRRAMDWKAAHGGP